MHVEWETGKNGGERAAKGGMTEEVGHSTSSSVCASFGVFSLRALSSLLGEGAELQATAHPWYVMVTANRSAWQPFLLQTRWDHS